MFILSAPMNYMNDIYYQIEYPTSVTFHYDSIECIFYLAFYRHIFNVLLFFFVSHNHLVGYVILQHSVHLYIK